MQLWHNFPASRRVTKNGRFEVSRPVVLCVSFSFRSNQGSGGLGAAKLPGYYGAEVCIGQGEAMTARGGKGWGGGWR